ncbi:hypothetical protein BRC19_02415 [Candidatus Saccharibacteria bacterium QS_5_54_17]|nr:MAG: hypothetical protein BRC19_02415 [Candidatus Saccharibacteria bacterium QS_5_54_17]
MEKSPSPGYQSRRGPEIETVPFEEGKVMQAGYLDPQDIASVKPDFTPERENGKKMPLAGLQPGDLLHMLFDKRWDGENRRDYYRRVLCGRVAPGDGQPSLLETGPAVQLRRPLELPGGDGIPEGEIVNLGGTLYRPQASQIELRTGIVQGGERFCVSHRDALIDAGAVSAIRVNTATAYDDSHW